MDYYHRTVKPAIISEFKGHDGGDFKYKVKGKELTRNFNVCGTNPDFEVDRTGDVWPNATKDPKGLCDKVRLHNSTRSNIPSLSTDANLTENL